jgi:hypothetical protein
LSRSAWLPAWRLFARSWIDALPRHARGRERQAHCWGKTNGKIAFKVDIERPRLRGFDGKEHPVPSWEASVAEDCPAQLPRQARLVF